MSSGAFLLFLPPQAQAWLPPLSLRIPVAFFFLTLPGGVAIAKETSQVGNGTTSKPLKAKDGKGISHADKRREEKRQVLREYLLGQTYLRDIHADLAKEDITEEQLPVIKFKTETRLKLLAKVLPDLARVEQTGEDGGPQEHIIRWGGKSG